MAVERRYRRGGRRELRRLHGCRTFAPVRQAVAQAGLHKGCGRFRRPGCEADTQRAGPRRRHSQDLSRGRVRGDVESPEMVGAHQRFPATGMQVHAEYTM